MHIVRGKLYIIGTHRITTAQHSSTFPRSSFSKLADVGFNPHLYKTNKLSKFQMNILFGALLFDHILANICNIILPTCQNYLIFFEGIRTACTPFESTSNTHKYKEYIRDI